MAKELYLYENLDDGIKFIYEKDGTKNIMFHDFQHRSYSKGYIWYDDFRLKDSRKLLPEEIVKYILLYG